MFSYTSAISKKWLAVVFHGLKLGNIRNPFGHFFGHSSARYPPYPPPFPPFPNEKSVAFLRGASLFLLMLSVKERANREWYQIYVR